MNSEKSTVRQLNDEMYNASCIHCGGTEYIQLWPHRNNHGNMVGFVFACARCKDVVRGITLEIHGIRGHSEETRQPSAPAKPRRMQACADKTCPLKCEHACEHDEREGCHPPSPRQYCPGCEPVDPPSTGRRNNACGAVSGPLEGHSSSRIQPHCCGLPGGHAGLHRCRDCGGLWQDVPPV